MSKNFVALLLICGLLISGCDGSVPPQQSTTVTPTTPQPPAPTGPTQPPPTDPPTTPPVTPPVTPPTTPPDNPGDASLPPVMRCAPTASGQQLARSNSCNTAVRS